MKREGIWSDDSFELLTWFYVCSPILKVCLNIQKNQDFLQAKPNPKSPNDPWWVCTLSLIWWEMNCKIDLWHISVGIEMKHLLVWELYTFERFSSIWVNRVFSLMFFRNKMRIDLNLIWFYEFHLYAFISHCCVLKNVVLITLEVDSLHRMFIVFGVEKLKRFYIVIRSFLSIFCLRTSKILGWGSW